MEQDRRLELIDLAIQKLIEDNRNHNKATQHHNDHDAEYQLVLTNLLSSASQLEVIQRDGGELKQSEASSPPELVASVIQKIESENADVVSEVDGRQKGTETDEIVKELRKVKRQNFVTHCLLSVMIVLTVAWQLSEVSILMKVKDGLSHPFRSFGSMLKGMVKVPDMNNSQEGDNNKEQQQSESLSIPSLEMPEMPHVDVTNLGFSNGKQ